MTIDAAAFTLIEAKRNFQPQTIEIAKRRLLNDERAADLAAAYGVNIQRIYAIETQMAAALQEIALKLPHGWGEATIVAPKTLLREFQRQAEAARKQMRHAPLATPARPTRTRKTRR